MKVYAVAFFASEGRWSKYGIEFEDVGVPGGEGLPADEVGGVRRAAEDVFSFLNRDDRPNGATEPSLSVGDRIAFSLYASASATFAVAKVESVGVSIVTWEEKSPEWERFRCEEYPSLRASSASRRFVSIPKPPKPEDPAFAAKVRELKRSEETLADKEARRDRCAETLRAAALEFGNGAILTGVEKAPELVKATLIAAGVCHTFADDVRYLLRAAENFHAADAAAKRAADEELPDFDAPIPGDAGVGSVIEFMATHSPPGAAPKGARFEDEDPDGDSLRPR